MARINFDDSIYQDPRFYKLVIKTECNYKALGLLISAWILAQKYWLKHQCIPKDKWPDSLNILIDVGFAETVVSDSFGNTETEPKQNRNRIEFDSVYVKGSSEYCNFLNIQSLKGKKGGKSCSKNKLKHLKQFKNTETEPKQNRNKTEYSYSYSNSNIKEAVVDKVNYESEPSVENDNNNSSKKCDDYFSNTETQEKLAHWLNQIFKNKMPFEVKRQIPQMASLIIKSNTGINDIKYDLQQLINSINDKKLDNVVESGQRRYLQKTILGFFGLVNK